MRNPTPAAKALCECVIAHAPYVGVLRKDASIPGASERSDDAARCSSALVLGVPTEDRGDESSLVPVLCAGMTGGDRHTGV